MIREMRKKRGWTQDQLAEKLGTTKRTVVNYEAGKLIPESKMALLRHIFNDGMETVSTPEAVKVNYYDEMSVMYVPLINQYAYGGYSNGGYADPEYIESLPKIPFADDKEHRGEYLCFEVKGDSMDNGDASEAILERDILLCRNIRKDYWKSKLHINKWDFVIVHREKGILVKRIIDHNVEEGIITLHSLNDFYEDIEVSLADVSQILNIVDIQRKKSRR